MKRDNRERFVVIYYIASGVFIFIGLLCAILSACQITKAIKAIKAMPSITHAETL
mgnify:CR=1 FL=1